MTMGIKVTSNVVQSKTVHIIPHKQFSIITKNIYRVSQKECPIILKLSCLKYEHVTIGFMICLGRVIFQAFMVPFSFGYLHAWLNDRQSLEDCKISLAPSGWVKNKTNCERIDNLCARRKTPPHTCTRTHTYTHTHTHTHTHTCLHKTKTKRMTHMLNHKRGNVNAALWIVYSVCIVCVCVCAFVHA